MHESKIQKAWVQTQILSLQRVRPFRFFPWNSLPYKVLGCQSGGHRARHARRLNHTPSNITVQTEMGVNACPRISSAEILASTPPSSPLKSH